MRHKSWGKIGVVFVAVPGFWRELPEEVGLNPEAPWSVDLIMSFSVVIKDVLRFHISEVNSTFSFPHFSFSPRAGLGPRFAPELYTRLLQEAKKAPKWGAGRPAVVAYLCTSELMNRCIKFNHCTNKTGGTWPAKLEGMSPPNIP